MGQRTEHYILLTVRIAEGLSPLMFLRLKSKAKELSILKPDTLYATLF